MLELRRKILKSAPILACVVGALLAPSVQAQDAKNYPGSSCVRFSGGSPTYNFSAIGNASSSSEMLVDCPVTKDFIGGDINDGWLRAIDRNSTRAVGCALQSINYLANNSVTIDSDSDVTIGNSTSLQTLTFSSLSATTTSHYIYSCSIPRVGSGTSYITTYQVEEQ